jgi:hypothetical protein
MPRSFADLVELVRREDPALERVELAPDGKFQTRLVTLDEVTRATAAVLAPGFAPLRERDLPLVAIGWGKCRVGSTALTNLFGIAGVPAYYQPVKTVIRYELLGGRGRPWHLPEGADVVFAKEMAGPYVYCEALFNPVRCLVEAGYPPSRIHLLVLERDPEESLASWLDKWSHRLEPERLVRNFALSSLNAGRMRSYAAKEGVAVTHFPYEASRQPELTVERLLSRLDASDRYRPEILEDWGASGQLESAESAIVFPEEPEPYAMPGLHGSGGRYRYRSRSTDSLRDEHRETIRELGLDELHAEAVRACASDLGLDDAQAAAIFERLSQPVR